MLLSDADHDLFLSLSVLAESQGRSEKRLDRIEAVLERLAELDGAFSDDDTDIEYIYQSILDENDGSIIFIGEEPDDVSTDGLHHLVVEL